MEPMQNEIFMKKCIELAAKGKGYTSPNPLVGCVVVKNNKVISEGYHHKFGEIHAEIDALNKLKKGEAKDSTIYVNLEPCSFKGKTPACTDRIIKEGISKVVIGSKDPNPKVNGIEVLERNNIAVIKNVLPNACNKLNQFFFKWIATGLPYVTIKIAQTSDHFIAYSDGSCPHITNKQSRTYVHNMRRWYDAVLIGKGTVERDDPSLTIRHVTGRQPIRVILDSRAELINSPRKILTDQYVNKTIWVVSENAKFDNSFNVEVLKCKTNGSKIDLLDLLKKLAKKNISSVYVEGGPQIWQSFLDYKLVDQIQLFTANKKFKNGIKTLPNTDINTFKNQKAEVDNFGLDNLEKFYLNIY